MKPHGKRFRETLYIVDEVSYRLIKEKLRVLWFKKYGINLSKGDIVTAALEVAVDVLSRNAPRERHSIGNLYARTEK